jgi:PHP family Zn ribbon phosphoesterase
MVSGLDKKTLISNSDAHSPLKIGREANIFNTALSYDSIISAIKSGNTETFAGTIEYYPEEGKYYADGHRNCKYSQMPEESFKNGGICPVCGKEVTKGVLHRILELSDRLDYKPDERINYKTIPLIEILSEIYQMNPSAEKISACYKHLLAKLGPELRILNFIDIGELTDSGVPLLAEAIKRMRRNKVKIAPGFDGEYGTIEIFSRDEIRMADIKHIAVRNSRLYGI